jgi:hypothetical protein
MNFPAKTLLLVVALPKFQRQFFERFFNLIRVHKCRDSKPTFPACQDSGPTRERRSDAILTRRFQPSKPKTGKITGAGIFTVQSNPP